MWRHILKHLAAGGLCVGILIAIVLVCLDTWYLERFLPQTQLAGTNLANLTVDQAMEKINDELEPSDLIVILSSPQATSSALGSDLGLAFDHKQVLNQHLFELKQKPILTRISLIVRAWNKPTHLPTKLRLNQRLTQAWVDNFAQTVDQPGSFPQALLGSTNSPSTLEISPGKIGRVLSIEKTTAQVLAQVSSHTGRAVDPNTNNRSGQTATTQIVQSAIFISDGLVLTPQEVLEARVKTNQLVGRTIKFSLDQPYIDMAFSDKEIISILALPTGFNQPELQALTQGKVEPYNQPPQDAIFEYDPDTLAVTQFEPDRPGIEIDSELLASAIIGEVEQILALPADTIIPSEDKVVNLELPHSSTPPKIPLANTNRLGIDELIGVGRSLYAHSIPSRIHNVAHATTLMSGTLVPPGEEFSFNKTIGPVTRATGFKPAWVIKRGRTVLGDGGGVCQVSTTLFRAVLDTGLDVTLRLPHSYRVGYYEQNVKPGIDATVYTGNTDFRFINDTTHHILIFGQADSENLEMYFEIYGTSDGRHTEIVDHKNWGSIPAPPAQYIDDPSLPSGVVKQIEHSVPGLKTEFTNVIYDKYDNEVRRETFESNYIPWAAKYLVGTG